MKSLNESHIMFSETLVLSSIDSVPIELTNSFSGVLCFYTLMSFTVKLTNIKHCFINSSMVWSINPREKQTCQPGCKSINISWYIIAFKVF